MTTAPARPPINGRVFHQPQRSPVDLARAEHAATEFLTALGLSLDTESTADTPGRMARAFAELLTARPFQTTTFPNDAAHTGLIVVRRIPFHSLCEHHALPFIGTADVGYLPGNRIIGLSKLARIVEHNAKRFQVQERLTRQIADHLHDTLTPPGVGVTLRAEHFCMTLRGVMAPGTETVTHALLGAVRDEDRTRAEFLHGAVTPTPAPNDSAPCLPHAAPYDQ